MQRHHEERLSHVKSTSQTNARKRLDNTVPMTSLLLLPDHKKLLRETSEEPPRGTPLFGVLFVGGENGVSMSSHPVG